MAKTKTPHYIDSNKKTIDWKKMKKLWLGSILEKRAFLKSYGINPNYGNVRKATAAWSDEGKHLHGVKGLTRVDLEKLEGNVADAWSTIQEWRKGQGVSDWRLANHIKRHIQVILSTAMQEDQKGKMVSDLTPTQLSSLAATLGSIQKTQRLALGMSTENTGVIQPPDPNVESQAEEQVDFPMFVVEVNKNGKFERSRPRQIA